MEQELADQCHRSLELATGGELNILKQPEYANLKKLLNTISNKTS